MIKEKSRPGRYLCAMRQLAGCLALWLVSTTLQASDLYAPVMPPAETRGMLWRIDTPASPRLAPSYLFGTIHVDDPMAMQVLEQAQDSFRTARMVCTEVLMDYQAMAAEMRAMFYSDGRTLPEVLQDDALYQEVIRVAQTRDLPESMVRNIKPWALMYMLSMPHSQGEIMDQKIYTDAQRRGKQTCGLEVVEEHASAFDVFTLQDQVELLRVTIAQLPDIQQYNGLLIERYARQDLSGLVQLMVQMPGLDDQRLIRIFIDELIVARNHKMLRGLLPHLPAGGGFFAVGAMHLPGEQGILRLLEKRGYRVTPVPVKP